MNLRGENTFSAVSDSQGRLLIDNVPPGVYEAATELPMKAGPLQIDLTKSGEQIREASKSAGTAAAHSANAKALRSQSARHNALARSAWDPSSLPDWLNAEAFAQKIQPLLANVTTSAISTALGVSWLYAPTSVLARNARIHGIGRSWRNWWGCSPTNPMSREYQREGSVRVPTRGSFRR